MITRQCDASWSGEDNPTGQFQDNSAPVTCCRRIMYTSTSTLKKQHLLRRTYIPTITFIWLFMLGIFYFIFSIVTFNSLALKWELSHTIILSSTYFLFLFILFYGSYISIVNPTWVRYITGNKHILGIRESRFEDLWSEKMTSCLNPIMPDFTWISQTLRPQSEPS